MWYLYASHYCSEGLDYCNVASKCWRCFLLYGAAFKELKKKKCFTFFFFKFNLEKDKWLGTTETHSSSGYFPDKNELKDKRCFLKCLANNYTLITSKGRAGHQCRLEWEFRAFDDVGWFFPLILSILLWAIISSDLNAKQQSIPPKLAWEAAKSRCFRKWCWFIEVFYVLNQCPSKLLQPLCYWSCFGRPMNT